MKTGVAEIDALLNQLDKKFGSETKYLPDAWQAVSTGSTRFDYATGIGGIPKGGITEIYGWESSGKTSLAFQILARAQALRKEQGITDKRDLIIDLEHTMTKQFIEGFGIDMEQIIWRRPDSAEEAFQYVVDLPKSGKIDMCIFDSIDGAQNALQLSRDIGATDVGGVSKLTSDVMRRISKYSNTTFIFINQVRQNPGVAFGNQLC